MSDDFDEDDDDAIEEESEATPAPPRDPNAKVPFFRNWAFWASMIAALPAAFVLYKIATTAASSGESSAGTWPLMLVAIAAITGLICLLLTGLPFLIAIGKFMGGEDILMPAVAGAAVAGGGGGAGGINLDKSGGFDDDSDAMEGYDDDSGAFESYDDDSDAFEGFDDDSDAFDADDF